MKPNIAKFGTLMSFITSKTDRVLCYHDSDEILHMITDIFEVAPVAPIVADYNTVDQLMMLMNEGTRKIEAIKVHRTLTGLGLKESKDAIEKYWKSNLSPT